MARQLMPTLRVKNACPMALSTTSVVILLKSGWSRNCTPCLAPGILSETPMRSKMMRKRRGIMVLLNHSIPFCTPRETTRWVSSRKEVM